MTLRHDGGFFCLLDEAQQNSPRYTEEFLQLALAHHCILPQWGLLMGLVLQ